MRVNAGLRTLLSTKRNQFQQCSLSSTIIFLFSDSIVSLVLLLPLLAGSGLAIYLLQLFHQTFCSTFNESTCKQACGPGTLAPICSDMQSDRTLCLGIPFASPYEWAHSE